MRLPSLFSAGLALALITNSTLAGDVRLYRFGETPDPREVAAILDAFKARPIKTRSVRLLDAPKAPSALALPIRFGFDSSQVLPESKPALEAVASGIKLAGPAARIVIEGHTDAAGSDTYNMALSEKRALAVKTYLVLQHHIPAESLRTVGLGKGALIKPEMPLAPENRRVQFRADSDPS